MSIYHRQLGTSTVYLERDTTQRQNYMLKVGDFSRAKVIVPPASASERTPLTISAGEGVRFQRDDLEAAARIIHSLFTNQELTYYFCLGYCSVYILRWF